MTQAHQLSDLECSNPEQTTRSKHQETSFLSSAAENIKSENNKTEVFSATAIHDLKADLQLIASGISLFRRNYHKVLDEKADQILVAMSGGLGRMKHLINDLIELSKTKEERLRLELVDLSQLALSVVADLKPLIETNKAKISIKELPVVCGDKMQLYHVLQNLINNALKYRNPQVDPNITIHSHVVPLNELSSREISHEIMIEDNGIGFSNEQAQTLFEPFHRLNNPGIEGSGLGLSICKKILLGHRGRIKAEGTPGVGAKFIVHLPSIECCKKSDQCAFAASSYDKKCPALKR